MSGPAHRVQSAVEEFGYPNGHLGHLSPEQEIAFTNFKLLCAERGHYKPGEGEDDASHDDATLLRFLRARRFILQEAYQQFHDTEEWRKANHLDELYDTIDLEHYEETRRLYPQWTGRRDRRGIPVYVFEVRHLNSKTMAAYEKSAVKTKTKVEAETTTAPKLLRLFALYENLTRFVLPLCSALADRQYPLTPITQSNNIVDISGVGLKQFWNLRTHMQDASTLATAHYPETLDRIFIIGAPAFFPTVWGWIKKWFDPITTSKIFILGHHEVKGTLEKFIDRANIPKKYGGELEFHFGDFPVLDPAVKEAIMWENGMEDFPQGPKIWIHGKGEAENTMKAVAVGSTDEKQRREEVCVVNKLTDEAKSSSLPNGPDPDSSPLPARVLPAELLDVPTETATPTSESAMELEMEKSPEDPIAGAVETLTLDEKATVDEKVAILETETPEDKPKKEEDKVVTNGVVAPATSPPPAVKTEEKETAYIPTVSEKEKEKEKDALADVPKEIALAPAVA